MTTKLEYNKERKQFDLVVINSDAMSDYKDEKEIDLHAEN